MEYEQAQSELRDLQDRLTELQRNHPIGEKGFTKAGIRKLIARLNEELKLTLCDGSFFYADVGAWGGGDHFFFGQDIPWEYGVYPIE